MRYPIQSFFLPISIFLIFASAFSCDTDKKNNNSETTQRSNISVVAGKPMSVFINSDNKLTKEAQELFKGFMPDEGNCSYAHLLNPTLQRVDLAADTSIAPIIEKSGIASSKPVREFKLAAKYFEELVIAANFQKTSTPKSDSLYLHFLSSKPAKDSILLFSTNQEIDTIYIQEKSYKALYDIESIRKRIQSILCSNPKATITLLIDPPAQKFKSNSRPSSVPSDLKLPKPQIKKVSVVNRGGGHTRPIGDLTILKGSEGCDLCTRYYSAYDATGHLHEIKEKNSINCCPCNKTVEIRGQTFVMNCDGSPRLQPVE
jgi:hypothetical protein